MPTARVYGGRPGAARQQERRLRLMDAGLELFGTIGYRATTMRAVLQQAQLSERYFGENFESLRDLFLAVYDKAADQVIAATIAAVQGAQGDASAEIRAGMVAYLESVAVDPRGARIMLVEIVAVGPSLYDHGMSKMDIFSEFMAQRAAELGLKSSRVNVKLLARALVAAMHELQRQTVFEQPPLPMPVAVEHAVYLFDATMEALRREA
ncbi:transcriptional regulator, TetR family [Frankineae bacterium MT45]|nr:transcriptional regulator, TetR family [Frankineae bacterium MT45]